MFSISIGGMRVQKDSFWMKLGCLKTKLLIDDKTLAKPRNQGSSCLQFNDRGKAPSLRAEIDDKTARGLRNNGTEQPHSLRSITI